MTKNSREIATLSELYKIRTLLTELVELERTRVQQVDAMMRQDQIDDCEEGTAPAARTVSPEFLISQFDANREVQ